jgi:proline dehydrogenase
MLRSIFIYLSKAAWARRIVTGWSVAWNMASRFVAGETLDDAIRVIKTVNLKAINASLDHLGEHTHNPGDAQKATKDIFKAIDAICDNGLNANVSIKLTQIGLSLDLDLCAENLRQILNYAQQRSNFIRIDMEDATATQKTLDLVFQMRQEGFINFGIVIQSYLYRSDEDIKQLAHAKIPVRLCKGAYKEAASVAYPKKKDVDLAFDRMASVLIDASKDEDAPVRSEDGKFPPMAALATHDEKRINFALQYSQKIGLAKQRIEFQMLHGIRRDIQEKLAKAGYPVRVYVPYGTEWYPYFMRRLAERPANMWFFVINFFHR